MPSFVPVEILGVIISFIFDIESLFALRLVNRMWYNAVSRFDTHYLYVDLLSKNLDRFDDQVSKSKELNKLLRTLIWIIPDRPVSSVGTHYPSCYFSMLLKRGSPHTKPFSTSGTQAHKSGTG